MSSSGLQLGDRHRPSELLETLTRLGFGAVPGMTPAVFARLRPYLSVYQEADSLASNNDALPVSFSAPSRLIGDGWHLGSTGRIMLVMVEATAVGRNGGRFTRQTIVRLRAEASLDQSPFQILTWDTGAE